MKHPKQWAVGEMRSYELAIPCLCSNLIKDEVLARALTF